MCSHVHAVCLLVFCDHPHAVDFLQHNYGRVRRSVSANYRLSRSQRYSSSGLVVGRSAGIEDGEDVEIPWWTYGARGMQLWFPKSLAEPVSHAAAAEAAHYMTDPELEFDREVYPISISLAEVSIIGTLPSLPPWKLHHSCRSLSKFEVAACQCRSERRTSWGQG